MGFLKTRKNKKFGYTPRYYESDRDGSPYQMEHKFDKFRSTVGDNKGVVGKFKSAFSELNVSPRVAANRRIIIIAAVLVLIFLFIIDFDLSIFRSY